MKNRTLPLCLLALVLMASFTFSGLTGVAGNPKNPPSQTQQLTGAPSALNLNWMEVGPDNVAGRIRALIFDNQDPQLQTIIAGAVNGGLWKSTNLGQTWHKLNTASGVNLNVSCLLQTPSGDIYAGTGESFNTYRFTVLQDFNYTNGLVGHGLFKSTDGENFTLLPSTKPTVNSTTSDWAYVNELAYDATNGRVYAATNNGLLYSSDDNTWNFATTGARALKGESKDIKIAANGLMVTSVNDSCFVSQNANARGFTNRSLGTSTTLPSTDVGRMEFAIAPSNPDIVYASVTKGVNGDMMAIYRSNNKGTDWYVIFPGNNTFEPFDGKGKYANTIAVFPNDPDRVLLGGADMWIGRKFQETGYFDWAQTSFSVGDPSSPFYLHENHHTYTFRPGYDKYCMVANDGGIGLATVNTDFITFQTLIRNLKTTQYHSVSPGISSQVVLGGTQGNGALYIDGSGNSAEYATEIKPGNSGFAAISAINPDYFFYSEQGDDLYRSEDKGENDALTFLGDISNTQAFANPFLLVEDFDFTLSRDSVKYIAEDSAFFPGETIWVNSTSGKFPFPYTFEYALPQGDSIMIPDLVQSRFFVWGTHNTNTGVYMSKDALKFNVDPQWFLIAQFPDLVTCYGASKDMNYLWAGCKNGKLYRISNLALAYDSLRASQLSAQCIVAVELVKTFTNQTVSSIAVNPENPEQVLVTVAGYGFNDYVFLANDGLDSIPSFNSIQANLPKMPVYSSLFEMNNPDIVLLGTENGVYSTANINNLPVAWSSENNGLGEGVPIMAIKQQTHFHPYVKARTNNGIFTFPGISNVGNIYIATYGRGILMDTTYHTILGINPVTSHSTTGKLSIFPNPAKDVVTLGYQINKPGNVQADIYDLTGKLVQSTSLGYKYNGSFLNHLRVNNLPQGSYMLKLSTGQDQMHGRLIIIN